MTKYGPAESDGITELCLQVQVTWRRSTQFRPLKTTFSYLSKEQKCLFQLVMMPISVQLLVTIWHHHQPISKCPHHDALIADMDKSYTEYKENMQMKEKLESLFLFTMKNYLGTMCWVDFKADLYQFWIATYQWWFDRPEWWLVWSVGF